MKNLSTFAAFPTRTNNLTVSSNFIFALDAACISIGATDPHGLLDLSSDLFLSERGEVAFPISNTLIFSFMTRTMKKASKVKHSSRTRTSDGTESGSSYTKLKKKFTIEKNAKNKAYNFIISKGLYQDFGEFSRTYLIK